MVAIPLVVVLAATRRHWMMMGCCCCCAVPFAARADEPFVAGECAERGFFGKCVRETVEEEEEEETAAAADSAASPPPPPPIRAGGRVLPQEEFSSPLVERLRQQTEANKELNKRTVDLETFSNSQAGLFGPFSRFEPVMKPDGTFVLVPARDLEALKKANLIEGDGRVTRFLDPGAAAPYEQN